MAKISELPDELLVKILTFLPTKAAVSTSVLSKQWEFLWMWLPELEFNFPFSRSMYACLRDFIAKNLPLHKAPIESLRIVDHYSNNRLLLSPEDLNTWVGIAVSRCLRELSIDLYCSEMQPDVSISLPCSLYSCNSLVTLKLGGHQIIVDVPPTVCLPCLKTLELRLVTYSNEDSLLLLLSCCSVLEHLSIEREESGHYDNVLLPCSLYSLKSLVTLELQGEYIFVDVPPTVSLPSLKTLQLRWVTYSNQDSLQLLLSYCPVLEDLSIDRDGDDNLLLPRFLYSCNSLVTLKLYGQYILVDVPPTVCLPSLKTLELDIVTYSNDDSLRLLLSCCPALEDLSINREEYDNLRKLVIIVPSLQRLTLCINEDCSSDGCVIVTPSLKYFNVVDERSPSPYLIEHMPELEEADIILKEDVEKDTERLLKSITNVKRLSLGISFNRGKENVYPDGIVFSQLETLKLDVRRGNWSMLLVNLLIDSPNLRVLDLEVDIEYESDEEYGPLSSRNNQGFLNSLETFKFEGYDSREQEDREFLSFIIKHARCLNEIYINRAHINRAQMMRLCSTTET